MAAMNIGGIKSKRPHAQQIFADRPELLGAERIGRRWAHAVEALVVAWHSLAMSQSSQLAPPTPLS